MDSKKIRTGNMLIAVFLGANVIGVKKRRTGNLYTYDKKGNYNSFHSDWNELMPVVVKIESLPQKSIRVQISGYLNSN